MLHVFYRMFNFYILYLNFTGIFVTIYIIERFGRKITMAVQFTMFSICLAILYFCSEK